MEDEKFEILWNENRERLLDSDDEWREMRGSCKIRTGTDALVYAIPVVVGIVCLDYLPVRHELLKWGISAVVMIVVTAICIQVKSIVSGTKSAVDIEKRVKEEYRNKVESSGETAIDG